MIRTQKVLFLLPYPLHRAPSQRFRVEAFFPLLEKEGVPFHTAEFLDEEAWRVLYQKGSLWQKAAAVMRGFLGRLKVVLFQARKYDFIFIHREAAPLGPPVFEWWLVRVLRKKIIFDFDDAIWIPNTTEANRLAHSVKCFWKTASTCRWAYKIAAGNAYLSAYASPYNKQVTIVPTCVDTDHRFHRLKGQQAGKVVIGWTGSHSTLKYLDPLYEVLKQLEKDFDIEFLVICNQPPSFQLRSLRYLPWQEKTEVDDLLKIHIGIMPLEADAWSEGKCGFKIIQYLSLGIPAVASPVGVNKTIIQEGKNGFLCHTAEEWYQSLAQLIKDQELRLRLGQEGRKTVEQSYSIKANSDRFLSLFS